MVVEPSHDHRIGAMKANTAVVALVGTMRRNSTIETGPSEGESAATRAEIESHLPSPPGYNLDRGGNKNSRLS